MGYLMVSIWVLLHANHLSCSPASASGRSPTRLSPIATSRRWMSCKRYKHNAVSPCRTIRSVSVISLSSIGGLPRPHKSDLSGSKPLFPQTPLFVSFTHLRDISWDLDFGTDFETAQPFIPSLRFSCMLPLYNRVSFGHLTANFEIVGR